MSTPPSAAWSGAGHAPGPVDAGVPDGRTGRWLRLGQHALLLVLVLVCASRAIIDGVHPAAEIVGLLAFVLWYAVGIRLARRGTSGASWFVVLTALWVGLVLISPENVWLAFPLWLLAGHLLPLVPALLISLVTLLVVVAEPIRQSGSTTFAAIIGPAIGMLVALGIAKAQQALVQDGIERQRLITSLYAAQEERAALSGELARVQRAEGASSERTRLSRDIHDGIAQGFSSILLLVRAAQAEDDPSRLSEILRHVESGAVQGLEESRRVVGALAPTDLDEGSLTGAVRRVTDRFAAETGVAARVVVPGPLPPLSTTSEVALLRCVQGALANVRGHAAASRVVVSLDETGDSVRVDVVDDGRGFDTKGWRSRRPGSAHEGGYGLRATLARLHDLGGGLALESAPGEGTALSAWLPVPAHRTDDEAGDE